jgi:LmbE family N-acetylglucosaminyl deacetylase
MPTAFFISPHLDDVAFSCGGTLLRLADDGWTIHLCTIFTASVANPTGFALACQTDKGLAPEIDYMQLRRAEDDEFAGIAGNVNVLHLPHHEAPHRGYHSASELFDGVHADDEIWRTITDELQQMYRQIKPDVIFAPQGLGNHVDHLQIIRAVNQCQFDVPVCWYRDTPYAIRQPNAHPAPELPHGLREIGISINDTLARKIDGCYAYTTQIGFQFGGAEQVRAKLLDFHRAEAQRVGLEGYAEILLVPNEIEVEPRLSVPIATSSA